MKNDMYLAFVYCITFNQSKFIVDTMDGFCMQETSFPFICNILDDASTDGEPEVIKKYLQDHFVFEDEMLSITEENDDFIRYFAQHKNNPNCHFNVYLLKYNHRNIKKAKLPYIRSNSSNIKYMAFCEGDDYWVDSKKMQKEVGFLETHEDYGMVHTAYNRLNQGTGETCLVKNSETFQDFNDSYKWAILTNEIMVGTATVLCRTSLYDKVRTDFADDFKNARMGDVQTWFHFAQLSKVRFISDTTAVYRKNNGTLTSMNSPKRYTFLKNAFEVHYRLAKKYGAPDDVINKIVSNFSGSLVNVGIDYGMYDELIAFIKEYHPEKKSVSMALKIFKTIPFLNKNKEKRLISHLINR